MKKAVVAGDFHIPHADAKAADLLKEFLKVYKPDIFIINGDLLDFYKISTFDKVPYTGKTLSKEINIAITYISEWRKILPTAKFYYVEGNHEFRLKSYLIKNAPEVYNFLNLPDMLELDYWDVEWIGVNEESNKFQHTWIELNDIYIGHFARVSKHSAFTAKNLVSDFGVSLIQAHTHRMGTYNVRLLNGKELIGVEGGCMCNLNPSYLGHANWQHGFTIIEWTKKQYHITPIHIRNYEFTWGGKVFK